MKKTTAAIISLGSKSSEWTFEAMKKYFDEVDNINIKEIEVNIGTKSKNILYNGKPLKDYDCIFVKGSYKYAMLSRAITSIRNKRSYMPLTENAFSIGHNKLLTHLELMKYNIPMPKTYLSSTASAAKKILEKLNYPVILKFPEGTQGKGVMFADSYASASSFLDAAATLKQPLIIQEYIETNATDIRAIVVGNKVVASMQRKANVGEKRANIHAGATGEPYELDSYTKAIAVKAAHAIGAEICAVDILDGPKGAVVIELNISPGLQGITSVTKIDVADKIASHLAKKTREIKDKDSNETAKQILDDLGINAKKDSMKEIITNLDFRGERILLPLWASKITTIGEKDEVVISARKNALKIKKVE